MFRIAHITDIHIEHKFPKDHGVDARQNWELLLADVKSRKPDMIVFGGDIGETSIFPYFFNSLEKTKIPFHIVLGNHDKFQEVKPYLKTQKSENENELYYTFKNTENQFFILDTSVGKMSKMQLQWFVDHLQQSDLTPVLFVHHPFLSVPTRVDIDFPLENRDEMVKTLNNIPKEFTLFCGHYHTESFISQNNINQYITPSGAIQILQHTDTIQVNPDEFAYRWIEVEANIFKTEIVKFLV